MHKLFAFLEVNIAFFHQFNFISAIILELLDIVALT